MAACLRYNAARSAEAGKATPMGGHGGPVTCDYGIVFPPGAPRAKPSGRVPEMFKLRLQPGRANGNEVFRVPASQLMVHDRHADPLCYENTLLLRGIDG